MQHLRPRRDPTTCDMCGETGGTAAALRPPRIPDMRQYMVTVHTECLCGQTSAATLQALREMALACIERVAGQPFLLFGDWIDLLHRSAQNSGKYTCGLCENHLPGRSYLPVLTPLDFEDEASCTRRAGFLCPVCGWRTMLPPTGTDPWSLEDVRTFLLTAQPV